MRAGLMGVYVQRKKSLADVVVMCVVLLFPLGSTALADGQQALLRFSYWHEADAPFVLRGQDEQGDQGFIFELGKLISRSLGREPEFVRLPVARIEPWLQSGQVDIDCVTTPAWKHAPESLNWSPVIFKSADNILTRQGDGSALRSLDDLHGKKIGVFKSYTYHPDFNARVGQGKIETVKMNDLDHGLQLLRLGRIDALVDFGVVLQYQLAQNKDFELAPATIDQFGVQCAYSQKMPVDPAQVDKVIQNLVDRGEIERLLGRYR